MATRPLGAYIKNDEKLSEQELKAVQGEEPINGEQHQQELEDIAAQMNANAAVDDGEIPADNPIPGEEADLDEGDDELIEADPAEPKKELEVLPADAARAAIYAKSNKRETENAADEIFDFDDTVKRYGPKATAATFENAEGETQQQAEAPANQDDRIIVEPTDKTYVRQVIDGEERIVPLADLNTVSQKVGAADQRLQQATELVANLQQQLGMVQNANTPHAPTPGEEDAPADGDAPTDEDRQTLLMEVAENLQVGTAEEIAGALDKVLTQLGGGQSAVSQESIVEASRVAAFQEAERQDIQEGLTAFAEEYPEITKDKHLQDRASAQIYDEMRADIRALDPNYTDEVIDKLASDGNALSDLYDNLKMSHPNRANMRSRKDVILATGEATLDWLAGITGAPRQKRQDPPNPANPGAVPRSERKGRLAPAPAGRTRAQQKASQTAPVSEQQARRNAVAQLRKSRGQSASA
ncbi:MAG: hypothetical protein GY952_14145 [Rhodobacteraceae bacterium]|nr:hypothetical protein [Paracoccaceae bacterium]